MVPPTSQMCTFPNFCKVAHGSSYCSLTILLQFPLPVKCTLSPIFTKSHMVLFMILTWFYHSSHCQIPGNKIKDKISLTGSMDIWCFPTIFLTASNWYLSSRPIPNASPSHMFLFYLAGNSVLLRTPSYWGYTTSVKINVNAL